jgi:hypothetical protein
MGFQSRGKSARAAAGRLLSQYRDGGSTVVARAIKGWRQRWLDNRTDDDGGLTGKREDPAPRKDRPTFENAENQRFRCKLSKVSADDGPAGDNPQEHG